MKHLATLAAAFAASCSPAYAQESVVIPPEVVQACAQAGGCVIVPEAVLKDEMQKAFDAGRAEEAKRQKQCLKNTV